MALNLDDLIGSMQHGFHAGDRGNDLNEIRENLKMTLGQQALGPGQMDFGQGGGNNAGGSGRRPPNANRQWDNRGAYGPSHSSLDGDVAMLSGSVENGALRGQRGQQQQQLWQSYAQQQQANSSYGRSPMSMANDQGGSFDVHFLNAQSSPPMGFGGPGSVGSQGSSTSSFGFGGFAQAPANTPQQTPVESSALARQLQAELERARDQEGSNRITEADDERSEPPDWMGQQQLNSSGTAGNNRQSASLSPPPPFASATNGYSHQSGAAGEDDEDRSSLTPRKLVNGFQPSSNGGGSNHGQDATYASPPHQGAARSIGAGQ